MDQPAQHEEQGYSLGGALWGCPHAEDCEEPRQNAPESWQLDFRSSQLSDASVCLPLFQSCTVGKELVLTNAPRLTISLDISLPPPLLRKRQDALSEHVTMRQPLDTGLRLVTDYDDMLERERQRVNAMKLAIKFSTDERTDPLERRQDEWVALALRQLPLLNKVIAHKFVMYTQELKDYKCPWTEVVINSNDPRNVLSLLSLVRAPLPTDNRPLSIHLPSSMPLLGYACVEGLDDSLVERSQLWVFNDDYEGELLIWPSPHVPPELLMTAFEDTLEQLTAAKLPTSTLVIDRWPATYELLGLIANITEWKVVIGHNCHWTEGPANDIILHPLPLLTGLHIPYEPLTDDLLMLLHEECPALTKLTVLDVTLTRSYAHMSVKWEALDVARYRLPLEQLEWLPQPQSAPYAVQTYPQGLLLMIVLPTVTMDITKIADNVSFAPPPHIAPDTRKHALLQLNAAPSLRAEDQNAALSAALDHAASEGLYITHLYLSGWAFPACIGSALVSAAARWRDINVVFIESLWAPGIQTAKLTGPVPHIASLELVGMYEEPPSIDAAAASAGSQLEGTAARTQPAAATAGRQPAGAAAVSQPAAATAGNQPAGAAAGSQPACAAGGQRQPARSWFISVRELLRWSEQCSLTCTIRCWDCAFSLDLQSEDELTRVVTYTDESGVLRATREPRQFPRVLLNNPEPGLLKCKLEPPARHMTPEAQGRALSASTSLIRTLEPLDMIYLDGWTVCDEVLSALPALWPGRAVVLGSNMVWPQPGTVGAATLCHWLGWVLPCAPHIDWVVYDSCGPSNIAQLILSRPQDGASGTVHVITRDEIFFIALRSELSMLLPRGATVQTKIRECADVTSLERYYFSTPMTPKREEVAARLAQADRYLQQQRDCEALASALYRDAVTIDAAGLAADAADLRATAGKAAAMAQQAGWLAESSLQVKEQSLGQPEPGPVHMGSPLWMGMPPMPPSAQYQDGHRRYTHGIGPPTSHGWLQ